MNPFRKSPAALRPMNPNDMKRWVCQEQVWKQLQHYVENNENLVILGVEGSGKSTLLNMFFSTSYCQEAAQANKLIFTASLSDTEDGDDLCNYLIDQLLEAAQDLLPDSVNQKLDRTMAKAVDKSPKQTFVDLCDRLYKCGYTILMIQDGFEHFVSSPNITQEQHDMLRSLLDKDMMRCIIATNYDLERTSLPKDVQGSMYLQKFQQKLTLHGFSNTEAVSFLENLLGDDTIRFNEKQLDLLLKLTGCIPGLLETSAGHMYDMIQKRGRVYIGELKDILRDSTRVTLQRWCKYFTQEYEDAIEYIRPSLSDTNSLTPLKLPLNDPQQRTAAARLCDRGLWHEDAEESHAFNSVLLQDFFYNKKYVPCPLEKPETAVSNPYLIPGAITDIFPYGPPQITINNPVYNQNTYNNNTVNLIAPTQDILNIIASASSGRENLATSLRDNLLNKLPKGGLQNVQRLEGMSDEAYDAHYDQEFDKQYSDKVVESLPVDEDDELTTITEEQQLTLEQRFQEARQHTRPELTDAILEKVSARTGFYLKLSVVVEDALSILRLMQVGEGETMDCSPQMILYGKAVEQQLRDCLLSMFKQEPTFRSKQIKTTKGPKLLSKAKESETTIGTYPHIIDENLSELSSVCAQHSLRLDGVARSSTQWEAFWDNLSKKIMKVRDLRNRAAHPDKSRSPSWEQVDEIVALSFNMSDGKSIFDFCAVCNELKICLLTANAPGNNEAQALVNQERIFCCTNQPQRNKLHGHLEGQDYLVKISPSMVQKFRSANPNVPLAPQMKYRVRLLDYKEQHGELFFSAQLLSPV